MIKYIVNYCKLLYTYVTMITVVYRVPPKDLDDDYREHEEQNAAIRKILAELSRYTRKRY